MTFFLLKISIYYGMTDVYFGYYDIDELPDEVNHGLLIMGESVDPAYPGDPEPLFMFVPLNTVDSSTVIEIDTSEYQMKRVEFKSYDEQVNPFSEPHYNAIYVDTGGGILAGLVLEGPDSGERVLWLPYGKYEYQTFINAAIGMELKPCTS